ncbi:MAG: hypothetical protein IJB24_04315, partial [Clostridia bacterium]|nr:hypothetical protein [Clostridia bacterium]
NAVEAMETSKKGNRIEISYIHSDGSCIFTVCDNGPGISPRHINNIFKMGYSTKFDPKRTKVSKTTGRYPKTLRIISIPTMTITSKRSIPYCIG